MPKTLATATVDRLLHHAHVCQTTGDSVRLTQALAGAGVIPLGGAHDERPHRGPPRDPSTNAPTANSVSSTNAAAPTVTCSARRIDAAATWPTREEPVAISDLASSPAPRR